MWNAQVSISTPACVNFKLRPGSGNIHISGFNCDALAQRNVYKRTKEPINYRGPSGDRTYIHTYMFVVVNFDALAQTSDCRIERRQVVSLCWIHITSHHIALSDLAVVIGDESVYRYTHQGFYKQKANVTSVWYMYVNYDMMLPYVPQNIYGEVGYYFLKVRHFVSEK